MDQKLLFLINREWTSPALDRLMAVMSSAAFWAPLLTLAALAVMVWGGFRGRVFIAVAVLAFALNDGVVGRTVKQITNRPRPHQVLPGVRTLDLTKPAILGAFRPLKVELSRGTGGGEPGRSFPSNHASNTAAVALVATLVWRRRGWLAFIPALLVAWSRVYVGAHWPSDVLAGICFGLGVALLVFALAEWSWRRFGLRCAPRVAAQHPSLLSA